MTTYTTIPNGDVDQDSPITVALMTALRDNALAIQEGDATAPSLLSGIAAKSTGGAIGEYALMYSAIGSTTTIGSTTAASNLRYASIGYSSTGNIVDEAYHDTTNTPSGTWRCMSYSKYTGLDTAPDGITLWLRIT